MNTNTNRRTCQYCGRKAEAQKQEYTGRTFRQMDTRGRIRTTRETIDPVPAYAMNNLHERTCEARPQ